MFCRFFLVATMAGDRLGMDFGPFLLDMLFDIGDIPVATVAGVCSMNRLGKLSLVDLISVTTQAFRVIDTLITVFTAFDDKLLALFLRLRRFHAFSGFRVSLSRGRGWLPKANPNQERERERG